MEFRVTREVGTLSMFYQNKKAYVVACQNGMCQGKMAN